MRKKFLTVILCLCMLAGMLPVTALKAQAAGTGIEDRLNQLKNQYPAGSYWTVNGGACPYIASGDYPHVNHNNCKWFDGASECMGFARLLFYEIYGVYCSTLQSQARYDRENVAVGDYIRINGDSHSAIVIGRSGNTLTIVECNWGNGCRITWGRTISLSTITHFIHAPQDVYDRVNGTSTPPPTVMDLGSDFYAYINYVKPEGEAYVEAWGGDGTYTNVQISASPETMCQSTDPRQIWHFIRQGDGSYKIINEWCGWCLDVGGGIAYPEANVATWHEDHGGAPERWYIINAQGHDYWYSLATALEYPKYVMDIYGGSTDQGANVQLFERGDNNAAQQFYIYKLLSYEKPAAPAVPTNLRAVLAIEHDRLVINWSAVSPANAYDSRAYEVEIYDSDNKLCISRVVDTNKYSEDNTSLPAGTYTARVRSLNTKYASHSPNYASGYSTLDFRVLPFYTVSVTASPAEGGLVYGGDTLVEGSYTTVRARANSGYHFVEWRENGIRVSTEPDYGIDIYEDHDLTAVFEEDVPGPEVSPAPGPEVSPAPGPEISPTPEPEVSPTPGPEVSPTPGPEVSPTPEPEVSPTPGPEVSPAPEPEVSPIPEPGVSPAPEPEVSPAPEPEASPIPEPEVSPVPGPEASPTPEPEVNPMPEPEPEESPATGPEPEESLTQEPEANPAPKPEVSPAPRPEISPTPELKASPTPGPEASPTPGSDKAVFEHASGDLMAADGQAADDVGTTSQDSGSAGEARSAEAPSSGNGDTLPEGADGEYVEEYTEEHAEEYTKGHTWNIGLVLPAAVISIATGIAVFFVARRKRREE